MNQPRRTLILAVLLVALPLEVFAQRVTRRVFVRASDGLGKPVVGFTPAGIRLTEDGVAREVKRVADNVPMRIVLLVDSSSAVASQLTHFRAGLRAFFDTLPEGPEVAIISTGGQLRPRVPPTLDRQKLLKEVASFAADGGANAIIDALLEADRRFLKSAPDRWPVFVLLTTDEGATRGEPPIDLYNRMMMDYQMRGGTAHAIIIQGQRNGIVTDVVKNLVDNTGGLTQTMNISNSLDDRMAEVASRIWEDHQLMADTFEIEYVSDAKALGSMELDLGREDVKLRMSGRRPF